MAGKTTKRKDNNRTILKKGESQRKDGSYDFRWTDLAGRRHSVYAKTLTELREKEKNISKDAEDGIKYEGQTMTVDDLFKLWFALKRGVRDSTMAIYTNLYNNSISPALGQILIKALSFSRIKKFYIDLLEVEKKEISTIKLINGLLVQVLDFAVDDKILRSNPAKKAFSDIKKESNSSYNKRTAMTAEEQRLLFDFVSNSGYYKKWENILLILNGTGLRAGELLSLQWEDVDFVKNTINITKTIVYLKGPDKSRFRIHPTKTASSTRTIPMSNMVRTAFLSEKEYQKSQGIRCLDEIDGLNNFIFVGASGRVRNNVDLNMALKRIVDAYNKNALSTSAVPVFLPNISCHTFRHNFATRMFESNVNCKVVQSFLGHSDMSITMNIYTNMTEDIGRERIEVIDNFLTPFTPKFTPIGT